MKRTKLCVLLEKGKTSFSFAFTKMDIDWKPGGTLEVIKRSWEDHYGGGKPEYHAATFHCKEERLEINKDIYSQKKCEKRIKTLLEEHKSECPESCIFLHENIIKGRCTHHTITLTIDEKETI